MKILNNSNGVAVYLRKSRMDPDTEGIDETLARHEDTLMKFAEKYSINVTKIYKEVVSGDGLFTRPEMLRLLQDVETGIYSGVLCMEIDRLGRSSQKDGGIILETFQEHNVKIITPNKTYDLNNEFDEQSVEMQSFIARQELKSIKRRLRRGTEKTVEQGGHIAEPPYGYRRTYTDKKPTLEIFEDEANAVRMIFDWYVNYGYGSCTIAKKLNELGYKPRKGDVFARNTVTWILKNATYTGKIIWNKHRNIRKKSVNDVNRRIQNPEDKWIVSDGLHPAIISEELFEKAQSILNVRYHPPSFTGTVKNPFAGLIYCKKCTLPLQRQNERNGRAERLLCTTTACTRSIRLDFVETVVFNAIKNILKNAEISESVKLAPQSSSHSKTLSNAVTNLKKELSAALNQKSKLYDLLEKGVYDIPTFTERSDIISSKINSLEHSLSEYEKEIENLNSNRTLSVIEPKISNFADYYNILLPAEKNRLYKRLINKIYYEHTQSQKRTEFTIEIELNFLL